MFVLRSTHDKALKQLDRAAECYRDLQQENRMLRRALCGIIDQESLAPNATVKRIMKIARAALGL